MKTLEVQIENLRVNSAYQFRVVFQGKVESEISTLGVIPTFNVRNYQVPYAIIRNDKEILLVTLIALVNGVEKRVGLQTIEITPTKDAKFVTLDFTDTSKPGEVETGADRQRDEGAPIVTGTLSLSYKLLKLSLLASILHENELEGVNGVSINAEILGKKIGVGDIKMRVTDQDGALLGANKLPVKNPALFFQFNKHKSLDGLQLTVFEGTNTHAIPLGRVGPLGVRINLATGTVLFLTIQVVSGKNKALSIVHDVGMFNILTDTEIQVRMDSVVPYHDEQDPTGSTSLLNVLHIQDVTAQSDAFESAERAVLAGIHNAPIVARTEIENQPDGAYLLLSSIDAVPKGNAGRRMSAVRKSSALTDASDGEKSSVPAKTLRLMQTLHSGMMLFNDADPSTHSKLKVKVRLVQVNVGKIVTGGGGGGGPSGMKGKKKKSSTQLGGISEGDEEDEESREDTASKSNAVSDSNPPPSRVFCEGYLEETGRMPAENGSKGFTAVLEGMLPVQSHESGRVKAIKGRIILSVIVPIPPLPVVGDEPLQGKSEALRGDAPELTKLQPTAATTATTADPTTGANGTTNTAGKTPVPPLTEAEMQRTVSRSDLDYGPDSSFPTARSDASDTDFPTVGQFGPSIPNEAGPNGELAGLSSLGVRNGEGLDPATMKGLAFGDGLNTRNVYGLKHEPGAKDSIAEVVRAELIEKQKLIERLMDDVNTRTSAIEACGKDIRALREENISVNHRLKEAENALRQHRENDAQALNLIDNITGMQESASQLSRGGLISLLARLSEAFKTMDKERVELKRNAVEAHAARRQLVDYQKQFNELQDAHLQQSKYIQKMQKQQSKIDSYIETIEMQEKVIAKMQAIVEARLRASRNEDTLSSKGDSILDKILESIGGGGGGSRSSNNKLDAEEEIAKRDKELQEARDQISSLKASLAARPEFTVSDQTLAAQLNDAKQKVELLEADLVSKDYRIAALEDQLKLSAQESSREVARLRMRLFELEMSAAMGGESDSDKLYRPTPPPHASSSSSSSSSASSTGANQVPSGSAAKAAVVLRDDDAAAANKNKVPPQRSPNVPVEPAKPAPTPAPAPAPAPAPIKKEEPPPETAVEPVPPPLQSADFEAVVDVDVTGEGGEEKGTLRSLLAVKVDAPANKLAVRVLRLEGDVKLPSPEDIFVNISFGNSGTSSSKTSILNSSSSGGGDDGKMMLWTFKEDDPTMVFSAPARESLASDTSLVFAVTIANSNTVFGKGTINMSSIIE